MQEQAASALRNLVACPQKARLAIFAAGAVPLLVALLRSQQPALQQVAAGVVKNLGLPEEQGRHHCSRRWASAHQNLKVRSDGYTSDSSKRYIKPCNWLSGQQDCHHHRRRSASTGRLVGATSARCARGSSSRLVQVFQLATSKKDAIVAAGAVLLLVTLLSSDVSAVSAGALWNLVDGSQQNKDAITAVPLLVTLLMSHQADVQKQAAATLEHLAAGSQLDWDAILAAGARPLLVSLLSSDLSAVQEHTAGALSFLADDPQQNRDAITAGGVVPALIPLLRSAEQGCHHSRRRCPCAHSLAEVKPARQLAGLCSLAATC